MQGTTKSILRFTLLAFGLSWLAWLPNVLAGAQVVPGRAWPTQLPGLLGPAIAAVLAVLIEGRRARQDLLRRCTGLPRSPAGWLATLSPLVALLAVLPFGRLTRGTWPDLASLGVYSGLPKLGVLPVLGLVFLINGLGEEIGWRGFLLPRLQERFGVLRGTLALWPIWLAWHLPLFGFLASFQQMSPTVALFGWGLGLLAGTLVLANVTHLAGGSALAAALWHTLFNALSGTGLSALAAAFATTSVMLWALVLGFASGARRARWLAVGRPPG